MAWPLPLARNNSVAQLSSWWKRQGVELCYQATQPGPCWLIPRQSTASTPPNFPKTRQQPPFESTVCFPSHSLPSYRILSVGPVRERLTGDFLKGRGQLSLLFCSYPACRLSPVHHG